MSQPNQPNQPNLLVIAAREPTPGFTKTRLGRAIGMAQAAALYRAFLTDLAERFTPPAVAGAFDLAWGYTPADCAFRDVLAELVPGYPHWEPAIRWVAQDGDGWGVRQLNLLRWGRAQGYARVLLTASDSPQMAVATIEQAFAALTSHDVVMGRVHDGGYYAIGVSGDHDVLSGVPMSTSSAADGVVQGTVAQGLSIAEIAATFDVDEVGDLDRLRAALDADPALAPATRAALAKLTAHRNLRVASLA